MQIKDKAYYLSGEAPVLTCSLEGTPQTLSLTRRHNDYDAISYTLKLTYERRDLGSHTERRPITFFLTNLLDKSTWAILRHSSDGLKMMKQDGFDPPPLVNGTRLLPLADHQNDFITLYPGESWSDRIPLDDDELFEPFKLGDTYTFQFIGAVVQWWNWVTFQVDTFEL
jgi:hypothetical protein